MYCCQIYTSNSNDHSIQSNPHSYEKLSVQIINMSADLLNTKYDYVHIISNHEILNTSTVCNQSQTTKFKESVQYTANPKMSFNCSIPIKIIKFNKYLIFLYLQECTKLVFYMKTNSTIS